MGVENYIATLSLTPVTDGNRTFAEWQADFDCAPEREERWCGRSGKGVFQAGLDRAETALRPLTPADGHASASTIIDAPIDEVWAIAARLQRP